MNILLRKPINLSSSSSSSFLKHTLIPLITFHSSSPSPSSSTNSCFVVNNGLPKSGNSADCCRGFRTFPGALSFRACPMSSARFAIDEFFQEEKPNSNTGGNGDGDDEKLEVAKLGIEEEIVSALAKRGITKLFPIQRAVLEPAMQGRDMIGRARTGTGKTLAFGIPILDKIIKHNAKHGRGRNPLAIVLAPTRELARQVEREFRDSASGVDTLCVYGGVPISSQMYTLNYGVDVVVGTPGRVIDLLKRGALQLSEVKFVVLDEADQMLSVGFAEDVELILSKSPRERHTMMFSATMPRWVTELTQKYLKKPLTVDLVGDSDQKLPDGITLYSLEADMYGKPSTLGTLITEHANGGKCIVFAQRKRDADMLSSSMGRKFRCEALHGDITQSQRERTLSGFRDGQFNILIATDVAARGLDVPNVDLVIHYELPNNSETFVHRSGRTGRAGKKGSVILMYTQEQGRAVRVIEQDIGVRFKELQKIPVDREDPLNSFGGSRFSRAGGFDRSGFSGSGGRGGSGIGRSSFGQTGGYNQGGSGRFGSAEATNSRRSGGFCDSSSGRSGGFGNSSLNPFGNSGSSRFGQSGRSADSGSGRSGRSGDGGSSRFDDLFRGSRKRGSDGSHDFSS